MCSRSTCSSTCSFWTGTLAGWGLAGTLEEDYGVPGSLLPVHLGPDSGRFTAVYTDLSVWGSGQLGGGASLHRRRRPMRVWTWASFQTVFDHLIAFESSYIVINVLLHIYKFFVCVCVLCLGAWSSFWMQVIQSHTGWRNLPPCRVSCLRLNMSQIKYFW